MLTISNHDGFLFAILYHNFHFRLQIFTSCAFCSSLALWTAIKIGSTHMPAAAALGRCKPAPFFRPFSVPFSSLFSPKPIALLTALLCRFICILIGFSAMFKCRQHESFFFRRTLHNFFFVDFRMFLLVFIFCHMWVGDSLHVFYFPFFTFFPHLGSCWFLIYGSLRCCLPSREWEWTVTANVTGSHISMRLTLVWA